MKKIIKFFTDTGIVVFSVVLMILTTVNFQIRNPKFINNTLKNPGVYDQIQKAIKTGLKEYAVNSYINEKKITEEKLTLGEKSAIEKQVDSIVSKITKPNLQKFTEENVQRILSYTNGKSKDLILYTPFAEWGIITDEKAVSSLPNETNVLALLNSSGNTKLIEDINSLRGYTSKMTQNWIITLLTVIGLFILHIRLTESKDSKTSLARLLAWTGGGIIAISAILRFTTTLLVQSSFNFESAINILVGSVVPVFVTEVTKLWFAVGSFMLLIGLTILAVKSIVETRERNKKIVDARKGLNLPKD